MLLILKIILFINLSLKSRLLDVISIKFYKIICCIVFYPEEYLIILILANVQKHRINQFSFQDLFIRINNLMEKF